MKTENQLGLSRHIALLVALCVVGGLALTGAFVCRSLKLDKDNQALASAATAELEVRFIKNQVQPWFVTIDTLFVERGESVGVLEEAAVIGADRILASLTELKSSPALSAAGAEIDGATAVVEAIRTQLVTLSDTTAQSFPSQRRAARERIEQQAHPLPAALHKLEAQAELAHSSATGAVHQTQRQLKSWGLIGLAAYLLFAFGAWWYARARITNPIESFAEEAWSAYTAERALETERTGPPVVRSLAQTFAAMATDVLRSRETARVLEAETDALLESIPAVLIGLDPTGRIALWNAEATKRFGLLQKQAVNRLITELPIPWIHSDTSERLVEAMASDFAQSMPEIPFTDEKGKARVLSVTTTPVSYGAQGMGTLILGTDITEQRSLEAQVRHSQKLESVGQLAAGIAHEINTPIQYVGHSIHFLQEAFDDMGGIIASYKQLKESVEELDSAATSIRQVEAAEEEADLELLEEEVPSAIERAIEGVSRVANIVGAMKRFAHPGAMTFAPANLNEAVQTTLTVANNEFRYVANINQQLATIPAVECDLGDINQVLLNLIVNAAHAIEEKGGERGTITIRTRLNGDRVAVEISDTGMGIPEDVAQNIFDPFFTTKEVGKGTGQGLAIAHSIICEKHGGALTYETKAGQGTTFRIELPVRQGAAA